MRLASVDGVLPTNKLLVSHIVAILMYHFGVQMMPLPPEILESYQFLIAYGIGILFGYYTPDFANKPWE